jgi:uncharacterized protein YegL
VRGFSDVGKASVKPYYPKEAPLAANTVRVLLDVASSSSTAGRAALDLVVVLDVSGSMRNFSRLDKLKSAMRFIIKKLTPIDRLSIVTFNGGATRKCPLRAMSGDAVPVLTDIVDGLVAGGNTNIEAGLKKGLEVLDGRRYTSGGRTTGVILMSDGVQTDGDATRVRNPRNYPVFTLSFGAKADLNLLQKIASGGGTYNPVLDSGGVSMLDVFSQLMAGFLTVVVRDLYLILSKPAAVVAATTTHPDVHDLDKIVKVDPGDFRQDTDAQSGAVTVKFGDLFSGEVRKVVVELSLKETSSSDYDAEILDVEVSYLDPDEQDKRKKLVGQTLHVKRTSTASGGGTTPELEAELLRRQHAVSIRAARLLADDRKLAAARASLQKAQRELEGVLEGTNPMVAVLKTELQQLMDCMGSEEVYRTKGKPYALAVELSHARQRFAARGVNDGVRLFATPRMQAYLEQARKFAEDSNAPLPTADADVDEVPNAPLPTAEADVVEVPNAPAPLPTADADIVEVPNAPAPLPTADADVKDTKTPQPTADADADAKVEVEIVKKQVVDDAPSKVVYYLQVTVLLLKGIENIVKRLWERLGMA